MKSSEKARRIVFRHGKDILRSDGMQRGRHFLQHGSVSVYEHSIRVAVMCVSIAAFLSIRVDLRSLVRGALLHDYFLYDWHEKDGGHRLHGFFHAGRALENARRDFGVNPVEQNMIKAHMFPLNPVLPRYRESIILCVADKLCSIKETLAGRRAGKG